MREVAVPGFPLLVVLEPLLELPVAADTHRRQPLAGRAHLRAKLLVDAEQLARGGDALEEAGDDLRVARRRHAEAGSQPLPVVVLVLRTERRAEQELARLRVRDEVVEAELGRLAQRRIRA